MITEKHEGIPEDTWEANEKNTSALLFEKNVRLSLARMI